MEVKASGSLARPRSAHPLLRTVHEEHSHLSVSGLLGDSRGGLGGAIEPEKVPAAVTGRRRPTSAQVRRVDATTSGVERGRRRPGSASAARSGSAAVRGGNADPRPTSASATPTRPRRRGTSRASFSPGNRTPASGSHSGGDSGSDVGVRGRVSRTHSAMSRPVSGRTTMTSTSEESGRDTSDLGTDADDDDHFMVYEDYGEEIGDDYDDDEFDDAFEQAAEAAIRERRTVDGGGGQRKPRRVSARRRRSAGRKDRDHRQDRRTDTRLRSTSATVRRRPASGVVRPAEVRKQELAIRDATLLAATPDGRSGKRRPQTAHPRVRRGTSAGNRPRSSSRDSFGVHGRPVSGTSTGTYVSVIAPAGSAERAGSRPVSALSRTTMRERPRPSSAFSIGSRLDSARKNRPLSAQTDATAATSMSRSSIKSKNPNLESLPPEPTYPDAGTNTFWTEPDHVWKAGDQVGGTDGRKAWPATFRKDDRYDPTSRAAPPYFKSREQAEYEARGFSQREAWLRAQHRIRRSLARREDHAKLQRYASRPESAKRMLPRDDRARLLPTKEDPITSGASKHRKGPRPVSAPAYRSTGVDGLERLRALAQVDPEKAKRATPTEAGRHAWETPLEGTFMDGKTQVKSPRSPYKHLVRDNGLWHPVRTAEASARAAASAARFSPDMGRTASPPVVKPKPHEVSAFVVESVRVELADHEATLQDTERARLNQGPHDSAMPAASAMEWIDKKKAAEIPPKKQYLDLEHIFSKEFYDSLGREPERPTKQERRENEWRAAMTIQRFRRELVLERRATAASKQERTKKTADQEEIAAWMTAKAVRILERVRQSMHNQNTMLCPIENPTAAKRKELLSYPEKRRTTTVLTGRLRLWLRLMLRQLKDAVRLSKLEKRHDDAVGMLQHFGRCIIARQRFEAAFQFRRETATRIQKWYARRTDMWYSLCVAVRQRATRRWIANYQRRMKWALWNRVGAELWKLRTYAFHDTETKERALRVLVRSIRLFALRRRARVWRKRELAARKMAAVFMQRRWRRYREAVRKYGIMTRVTFVANGMLFRARRRLRDRERRIGPLHRELLKYVKLWKYFRQTHAATMMQQVLRGHRDRCAVKLYRVRRIVAVLRIQQAYRRFVRQRLRLKRRKRIRRRVRRRTLAVKRWKATNPIRKRRHRSGLSFVMGLKNARHGDTLAHQLAEKAIDNMAGDEEPARTHNPGDPVPLSDAIELFDDRMERADKRRAFERYAKEAGIETRLTKSASDAAVAFRMAATGVTIASGSPDDDFGSGELAASKPPLVRMGSLRATVRQRADALPVGEVVQSLEVDDEGKRIRRGVMMDNRARTHTAVDYGPVAGDYYRWIKAAEVIQGWARRVLARNAIMRLAREQWVLDRIVEHLDENAAKIQWAYRAHVNWVNVAAAKITAMLRGATFRTIRRREMRNAQMEAAQKRAAEKEALIQKYHRRRMAKKRLMLLYSTVHLLRIAWRAKWKVYDRHVAKAMLDNAQRRGALLLQRRYRKWRAHQDRAEQIYKLLLEDYSLRYKKSMTLARKLKIGAAKAVGYAPLLRGDRVVARYFGGPYEYPATVQEVMLSEHDLNASVAPRRDLAWMKLVPGDVRYRLIYADGAVEKAAERHNIRLAGRPKMPPEHGEHVVFSKPKKPEPRVKTLIKKAVDFEKYEEERQNRENEVIAAHRLLDVWPDVPEDMVGIIDIRIIVGLQANEEFATQNQKLEKKKKRHYKSPELDLRELTRLGKRDAEVVRIWYLLGGEKFGDTHFVTDIRVISGTELARHDASPLIESLWEAGFKIMYRPNLPMCDTIPLPVYTPLAVNFCIVASVSNVDPPLTSIEASSKLLGGSAVRETLTMSELFAGGFSPIPEDMGLFGCDRGTQLWLKWAELKHGRVAAAINAHHHLATDDADVKYRRPPVRRVVVPKLRVGPADFMTVHRQLQLEREEERKKQDHVKSVTDKGAPTEQIFKARAVNLKFRSQGAVLKALTSRVVDHSASAKPSGLQSLKSVREGVVPAKSDKLRRLATSWEIDDEQAKTLSEEEIMRLGDILEVDEDVDTDGAVESKGVEDSAEGGSDAREHGGMQLPAVTAGGVDTLAVTDAPKDRATDDGQSDSDKSFTMEQLEFEAERGDVAAAELVLSRTASKDARLMSKIGLTVKGKLPNTLSRGRTSMKDKLRKGVQQVRLLTGLGASGAARVEDDDQHVHESGASDAGGLAPTHELAALSPTAVAAKVAKQAGDKRLMDALKAMGGSSDEDEPETGEYLARVSLVRRLKANDYLRRAMESEELSAKEADAWKIAERAQKAAAEAEAAAAAATEAAELGLAELKVANEAKMLEAGQRAREAEEKKRVHDSAVAISDLVLKLSGTWSPVVQSMQYSSDNLLRLHQLYDQISEEGTTGVLAEWMDKIVPWHVPLKPAWEGYVEVILQMPRRSLMGFKVWVEWVTRMCICRRQTMARAAFYGFVSDGEGNLSLRDLRTMIDTMHGHLGEKKRHQLLRIASRVMGMTRYYVGIQFSIRDFDQIIKKAWTVCSPFMVLQSKLQDLTFGRVFWMKRLRTDALQTDLNMTVPKDSMFVDEVYKKGRQPEVWVNKARSIHLVKAHRRKRDFKDLKKQVKGLRNPKESHLVVAGSK